MNIDDGVLLASRKWNELITKEVGTNISDMELSSLSSWVIDCYESFRNLYDDLLKKFEDASLDDHDLLHDCVVDIYWQLDHIKNHIKDSEKGFAALMRALSREEK